MEKLNIKNIIVVVLITTAILIPLNHQAKAIDLNILSVKIKEVFAKEVEVADNATTNSCDMNMCQTGQIEAKKTMRVTATAYSSTPDQTDSTPFITASGTHVHNGTLAANFLPIGTKVKLPEYSGDKIYIVEDRMHPRFSDRIDLWFPTRQEAIVFGKRNLQIKVLK